MRAFRTERFLHFAFLDQVGRTAVDPRLKYINGFFYKRHLVDRGPISSIWLSGIDVAEERIKRNIINTELERFRLAEQLC